MRSPTPTPKIRQKAIDHHFECIDVMDATGSRDLKIWLAEGSNYPGQADMRGRQDRLAESLATIYERLGRTSGWCSSTSSSSRRSTTPTCPTGARRTPTSPPSATAPWSASTPATTRPGPTSSSSSPSCSGSGSSASFDFNSRFYADDDLIVGAADPYQLFRILFECVRGGAFGPDSDVAYMLDQCHNIEKKIPGQIRSVLNVQEMTARALLVDTGALTQAQEDGDVLLGQRDLHGRVLHRRTT